MEAALDQRLAPPNPTLALDGLIVAQQGQLPALTTAVVPTALSHQARFDSLMVARGKEPQPHSFVGRFFNDPHSWGAIGLLVGASAAVPAGLTFGDSGWGAGTVAAIVLGLAGVISGSNGVPSPLVTLASQRRLKPKHVAFLSQTKAAPPLERATVGLLAKRWLERIDKQRVDGHAAFVAIEDLARATESLPQDVREQARIAVALVEALHDPSTGAIWRTIDRAQLQNLIDRFEQLPAAERAAAAPVIKRMFFNDDVPRITFASHESGRALYRVLHDAESAKANYPA